MTSAAASIDASPPPGRYSRFMLNDFLPERCEGRFVQEPARRIPVLTRCDVAVLGGGPAGVCAAVAAARMGKKVVLVERYGFLGGTATAASVNIWHSLYGMDRQTKVIGGLPEEVIDRLLALKAARNGAPDGRTSYWTVCTETAKLVFDDLVVGAGVRLLLHAWLADVVMEKDRVVAAIVETKSGRQAIEAATFIDCTGDADLARRAGLPLQFGNAQGHCQPPTLCFRLSGPIEQIPSGELLEALLFNEPMDYNGEPYPCFLWGQRGVLDPGELMYAGTRVPNTNVADALELTRAEVHARYQMRWVMRQLQSAPGCEKLFLRDIATQIGTRESYRIEAEHMVTREEILNGTRFEDTIAQGTYPIDIHNPKGRGIIFYELDGTRREITSEGRRVASRWDGAAGDAPKRDTLCWSVPYRSLIAHGAVNVLAAGRCIGVDHEAAGATRVMISAMQFGQAAGAGAALAQGGAVRNVSGECVRDELRRQGVPIL